MTALLQRHLFDGRTGAGLVSWLRDAVGSPAPRKRDRDTLLPLQEARGSRARSLVPRKLLPLLYVVALHVLILINIASKVEAPHRCPQMSPQLGDHHTVRVKGE